jgi:hypothetical protein
MSRPESMMMEEAQPAVFIELGERKWPQRPAQQDRNLGGDESGTDDDQQRQGGITGVEVQYDCSSRADLDAAHQRRQLMSVGQSDRCKALRAQLIGPEKFEHTLQQEDETHNHTDQDHGKNTAHRCLLILRGLIDLRVEAKLQARQGKHTAGAMRAERKVRASQRNFNPCKQDLMPASGFLIYC